MSEKKFPSLHPSKCCWFCRWFEKSNAWCEKYDCRSDEHYVCNKFELREIKIKEL